ncbi:DddA-like double-stranded DNA deaminase toxin [Solwaraspora sp. WMMD792]|uniref:DddA-like double-stranded DNA deaminase toxin n=1 Tax=Solwaraspora sp. WMMD792 TaxID=3016099 RepID=UPI0024177815|nr:DddA-like double-stranded DNA deaminase toxin [Solwaraspora sp. WMMD792]MDG4769458.1 SCP1.201-like deaminase [Solwaraspora sp. WMMD792]
MSLAAVRARLQDVLKDLAAETQRLAVIRRDLEFSRSQLETITRNSRHQAVADTIMTITTSIRRIGEAEKLSHASALGVVAYGRILGFDLAAGVARQTSKDGHHGASNDSTSTGRGETAGAKAPQWLQDASRQLPRRGKKGPTHGLLYDASGKQMISPPLTQGGGALRSGGVPDARAGIRTDWHALAQVTREHVEAHAAAALRKPGSPTEATLVVNKPSCVTRGEYVGCDEVLPGLIPEGKRLAVYLWDGDSATLQRVYTGTGEGIRR